MNYLTPQEVSEKWGIGLRRVQYLCSNDKIPGVRRVGRQWLIPEDAPRPADGRSSKGAISEEAYHFPILALSRYANDRSGLSEAECLLLDAQFLTAKGDAFGSSRLCQELIAESRSSSVLFGAVATNAYNAILLGQASTMKSCVLKLNSLLKRVTEHKEDYKFILAALSFISSFDGSEILEIDPDKLSGDALLCFEFYLMQVESFCGKEPSAYSIKYCEALCKQYEYMGIHALLPMTRVAIATRISAIGGDKDAYRYHLSEACRICYERQYISFLSKCAAVDYDTFHELVQEYGPGFASKVERAYQANFKNWQIIFAANRGDVGYQQEDTTKAEFILLVHYGWSNQEIADFKSIEKKDVDEIVKEICRDMGVANKTELREHLKRVFKTLPSKPEDAKKVQGGGVRSLMAQGSPAQATELMTELTTELTTEEF